MAKKLKTFLTSIGFFEQAVAAPSMKAALEAWGAGKNLFHQGFATETDDPAIVAATMAKPGVVLKRAVGSKGAFTENPQLPKSLPVTTPKHEPRRKPAKVAKAKSANVVSLADARAAKLAAAQYDKEQARREKEEEKKEAARAKERERRAAEIKKAQAALAAAEKRHDETMAAIAREREALNSREEAEEVRWLKEKKKLQSVRDRL
jgi:hypothetical protein